MKLFMDMEFTGLHQYSTIISLGLVSEYGDTFYAEFTDYDDNQVNDWLVENVINNLTGVNETHIFDDKIEVQCTGDEVKIKRMLDDWLGEILQLHEESTIDIWGDCLAYDWVLFNNLYDHAFNIPYYINYIPYDICTMFKLAGINPDINREEFINDKDVKNKHNALHDAEVIKKCFNKLSNMIIVIKK